jgi:hypothetical protein
MPSQFCLRCLAVIGVSAVLLQQAMTALPLQPRQEYGIPLLLIALPAVSLVLYGQMPRAAGRLHRHKDLLVPLGIYTFAAAAIGWLASLPATAAFLAPAWPVKLGIFSVSLSVVLVLHVALATGYAAWVTTLILDVVRHDSADTIIAFRGVRYGFFRVLALECIGWGVHFLGVGMLTIPDKESLSPALMVIALGALLWNLATSALLLTAMDAQVGFWEAVGQGIRLSWAGKARWWRPVVMQMLLVGCVTWLSISYSDFIKGTHLKQSLKINAFWTGSYEAGCRWYDALMEAYDAPKLRLLVTLLALLFGVLAIAVKLTIAEELQRCRASTPEGDSPVAPGAAECLQKQ